jgi:hypothetical protein
MALKKHEQGMLDMIQSMAKMLHGLEHDEATILSSMQEQIKTFEQTTNLKLVLEDSASDTPFKTIDLRKDFFRTRPAGEGQLGIKAQIFSVPISLRISKDDAFKFTNTEISTSLRELADIVDQIEPPITSLKNHDIQSVSGETPVITANEPSGEKEETPPVETFTDNPDNSEHVGDKEQIATTSNNVVPEQD